MPALPSGLDRADGEGGRPGVPSAAGQVITDSGGEAAARWSEMPDSPEIERAEQGTIVHRYRGSYAEAVARINVTGRGLVRTDSYGIKTKLLSCTMKRLDGVNAELTTVEEGVSFDPPPDEFSIEPVELGNSILYHPRYFYALQGDNPTDNVRNQAVIRKLQDYFENSSPPLRHSAAAMIDASVGFPAGDSTHISGTDLAKRAALEIIQKWWKGVEVPYVTGWHVEWSQFYYHAMPLNPGGYEEDPMTEAVPALPDYFWSPTDPPSTATIFELMAATNPQAYSDDGTASGETRISWLRKADRMVRQRTWFRVDRTWIGSPVGFWDEQLYSASRRPSAPGDYLVTNVTSLPD